MTPLHVAVKEAHIEIVQYFVGQNADINMQDENGVSVCVLLLTLGLSLVTILIVHLPCCLTKEFINFSFTKEPNTNTGPALILYGW